MGKSNSELVTELFEFFGREKNIKQMTLFIEKLYNTDNTKLSKAIQTLENTCDTMPSMHKILEVVGEPIMTERNDVPKEGETTEQMYDRLYREAYYRLYGENYPYKELPK